VIDYHGVRRYLVSLSTRDFSDKISPKSFAVAHKIPDALEYIESLSGIEADYDCLREFIGKYFRDGMVNSDIVGDEPGAYSVSINFKLKDSQYTWMYLSITLVYINQDDFMRGSETRPFVSVVCDKANVWREVSPGNEVLGKLGYWNFYATSARVENLFISRFASTLVEVSAIEASKTYRHGIRDANFPKDFIDFPKQTYIVNEKTEKVMSSDSPCRNVQTFSVFLSNAKCHGTQINFYIFMFPVIADIDGIITFQSYETYRDYSGVTD
jgi:hypothetical protein